MTVGPGDTTVIETRCTLPVDMRLFRYANHVHDLGTKVETWITRKDGSTADIKADRPWNPEWAAAPNWDDEPSDAPLELPAGTVVHVRCTYGPTGGRTIGFPEEMCEFLSVVDHPKAVWCLDGIWGEDGFDPRP